MSIQKILLLPDSFKGSMTATEICAILKEAIHRHLPAATVKAVPVADGGEGSAACFLTAMGGESIRHTVLGPYGEEMEAAYALLPDGTAVVEMAACAGLPLVGEDRDPRRTTTYGVGQLLAHAAGRSRKIIVGLGGSATNDGGAGAMAALGVRFLGEDGEPFVPTGGTLSKIVKIDAGGLLPALSGCEVITMCDIDNPLCGPRGASAVFGPQKGATPEMVEALDRGLLHYASLIKRDLGVDVLTLPGGGAAGGMGAGMAAFLHSPLQMGIQVVLDTVGFETLAADCDLILTGEGNLDSQSLSGKVVVGVGRRAKPLGKPVLALVGGISPGVTGEALRREGVTAALSITPGPQSLAAAIEDGPENLRRTADALFALLGAGVGA